MGFKPPVSDLFWKCHCSCSIAPHTAELSSARLHSVGLDRKRTSACVACSDFLKTLRVSGACKRAKSSSELFNTVWSCVIFFAAIIAIVSSLLCGKCTCALLRAKSMLSFEVELSSIAFLATLLAFKNHCGGFEPLGNTSTRLRAIDSAILFSREWISALNACFFSKCRCGTTFHRTAHSTFLYSTRTLAEVFSASRA